MWQLKFRAQPCIQIGHFIFYNVIFAVQKIDIIKDGIDDIVTLMYMAYVIAKTR